MICHCRCLQVDTAAPSVQKNDINEVQQIQECNSYSIVTFNLLCFTFRFPLFNFDHELHSQPRNIAVYLHLMLGNWCNYFFCSHNITLPDYNLQHLPHQAGIALFNIYFFYHLTYLLRAVWVPLLSEGQSYCTLNKLKYQCAVEESY